MTDKGLHTVILLLGSNLGTRQQYLVKAIEYIEDHVGAVIKQSSLYETEPWGNKQQPTFINQALLIQTKLSPEPLLTFLQIIELRLGRQLHQKWEARTIDIDILFYDNLVLQTENLIIPHPQFINRAFAILPVMEIAPMLVHPASYLSIASILSNCKDTCKVFKLGKNVS